MNELASVYAGYTAIHLFSALFHFAWYKRHPANRRLRAFAGLALGSGVYTLGLCLGALSLNARDSSTGLAVAFAGVSLAAAPFVALVSELSHVAMPRFARLAVVLGGVGLLLSVTGLMSDPAIPGAVKEFPSLGVTLVEPHSSILSTAWSMAVSIAICGAAAVALWSVPPARRLTVPVWAFLILGGGGIHDALIRLGLLDHFYLAGHASVLSGTIIALYLVTREQRVTRALASRTHELRRSHGELSRAHEKDVGRSRLAAAGELSAVIAHEVRNPLAVIQNATAALRRPRTQSEREPDDRLTLRTILDEESNQLRRLVTDLTMFASSNRVQEREFSVRQVVEGAVQQVRARFGASEERFEIEFEEPQEAMQGDPELIQRALTNLITNAVQSMPEGGLVTIAVAVEASEPENERVNLVFRVYDTGDGMDEEALDKARSPFFTTRARGTGLGLAIAERVAAAHDGSLGIKSEKGHGTQIELRIAQGGLDPAAGAKMGLDQAISPSA